MGAQSRGNRRDRIANQPTPRCLDAKCWKFTRCINLVLKMDPCGIGSPSVYVLLLLVNE